MLRKLLILVLTLVAVWPSASRPLMAFGKNKINYDFFRWKVYHSPHFDIHYYPEEEDLLQDMVSHAESAYLYLSKKLDHELKTRIPLVIYKTHAEFEQTNIILSQIPEAVGAFAEPLENRMVLPIDLPPEKLYALVVHELAHIFEYSILFQGELRRSFRANPPLWLMEGLAEHLAGRDDSMNTMVIRDAVVNNIVPPITQVTALSFLTYRFGEAAFDFIAEEFGDEGIRNFLFEYRRVLLTGNVGKAIKDSFGMEPEEFDRQFQRYLRKKYLPALLEKMEPEDYGREIGYKKKGVFTFSPSLSPSGELLAVLTTKNEDIDVVILSARDGEVVRNLTKGFSSDYEFIASGIFRGQNDISWSPAGDRVAFFARRENERVLFIVHALKGKIVLKKRLPVMQAASPAFSADGKELLFAANQGGVMDIFRLNLETGDLTNVTQDEFFDSNPRWSLDGRSVLYNRRINQHQKIFLVDLDDPSLKTQLTFGEHSDLQPSFSLDGKEIYFTSDPQPDAIFNIHSLDLETGEVRRWTDIVGGNFTPLEIERLDDTRVLAVTTYVRGRYRLFRMNFQDPVAVVRPEDEAYEAVEVVKFEPALQLTLDDEQKEPYKLKWHFEGSPDVLIGVADDGTVLSNAQIMFTDLLGDHRIIANFSSVSNFSSFDFVYVNMKRRWDWFVEALDFRTFYTVSSTTEGRRVEKAASTTGLKAGFIYPFDKFHRLTTSVGVFQRKLNLPVATDENGDGFAETLDFKEFSGTSPIISTTFTGDTLRSKPWVGPWHGRRYDLTVSYAPSSSGDFGDFVTYRIDWRNYQRVTSRSTLAVRFWGALSNGNPKEEQIDSSAVFSIGGFNQIRGYEYREFFGDRAAFLNVELRFPLIDALVFPGDWGIQSIQGFLFLDIGSAWYNGDLIFDNNIGQTGVLRPYEFYGDADPIPGLVADQGVFDGFNSDGEPTFKSYSGLVDGRGSYGIGFNFRFAGLLLNWTFAKRMPFTELELNRNLDGTIFDDGDLDHSHRFRWTEVDHGGFRSSFYIGTRF